METLVTKDDIVKLKKIVDFSSRMKDLTPKITTLAKHLKNVIF